jgi:protein-L-isoaspartate(D-aspartate) O-methyltransferase
MVKQQINPWNVFNYDVLASFMDIPRENFVPQAYRHLAFADINIPIGHNQIMMSPTIEAKVVQALNIIKTDKILEIGTGSGYMTALLANNSNHVYSVDIYEDFIKNTDKKLSSLGINNVTLQTVDGIDGWEKHAKYDLIVVTASTPNLKDAWLEQLIVGGSLFVITGNSPIMTASLVTRVKEETYEEVNLFETILPALEDSSKKIEFVL